MAREVKWKDIVAECGSYKDAFVATYRKYEGQPTDELDGQGRPTKVTMRSFAEHMGIARETFQRWVKAAGDPTWVTPEAKQARTATVHATVAKNLAKANPSALVDAIQAAGIGAEDQVFHELNLRRAGVDTSIAHRKASHAAAHETASRLMGAFQPVRRVLVVTALNEATEQLQELIGTGSLTDEDETLIREALEGFQIAFAEAVYAK